MYFLSADWYSKSKSVMYYWAKSIKDFLTSPGSVTNEKYQSLKKEIIS